MTDKYVMVSPTVSRAARRALAGLAAAPADPTPQALRRWALNALGLRIAPRGERRVAVWALGAEPTGVYGAKPQGIPLRIAVCNSVLRALERRYADAAASVREARAYQRPRRERRACVRLAGEALKTLRAARRDLGTPGRA